MNIQETNFFRVVLNSSKAGNNKQFNVDYRNDNRFVNGQKYYVIVENFTTPVLTQAGTSSDPIPILHIFIDLPTLNGSVNKNSLDDVLNIFPNSTNLLSLSPTIQLATGANTNNYQFNYNMDNLSKGVIMHLPSSFTISLKYLNLDGTNMVWTDWIATGNALRGFNLILRIYPLN
jgi:hypothetical protein